MTKGQRDRKRHPERYCPACKHGMRVLTVPTPGEIDPARWERWMACNNHLCGRYMEPVRLAGPGEGEGVMRGGS